jgi:hypothetical protein
VRCVAVKSGVETNPMSWSLVSWTASNRHEAVLSRAQAFSYDRNDRIDRAGKRWFSPVHD